MSTRKLPLFQAILARLSLGAVPVDGSYWFDPRELESAPPRERPRVPDVDWSPVLLSLSRPLRVPQSKRNERDCHA